MAMAGVAGASRKRIRTDPIGSIRPGKSFNHFPQIMAAFPQAISEIVRETTESLGARAQANAPVQPSRGRPYGSWNGRLDVAPGTLRRSMKTRFFKRKGTDITITGRVDFKAVDPARSKHTYAKAVEVGSVRTNASIGKGPGHYAIAPQPFLVPAIVVERPQFMARLQNLESLLPR